jgi:hypothetical protein
MLTDQQTSYVTKAASLLPAAAQPRFRQVVANLLAYEHPLQDRAVLDALRPLLAQHALSISEVLPPPRREYAHLERKKRHEAATTNTIL